MGAGTRFKGRLEKVGARRKIDRKDKRYAEARIRRRDFPKAIQPDKQNDDSSRTRRTRKIAVRQLDIVSPLLDANFTKQNIRTGLIAMNEPLWNEPPCACLASRIPYGSTITAEKLHAVYRAETILHQLGFLQVRVRHHGSVARIEVAKEELPKFFDKDVMEKINHQIRQAGFNHVSLDLAGYEQGSLNKDICL